MSTDMYDVKVKGMVRLVDYILGIETCEPNNFMLIDREFGVDSESFMDSDPDTIDIVHWIMNKEED